MTRGDKALEEEYGELGREVQAGLTELEGGSWEGKPPLEGG